MSSKIKIVQKPINVIKESLIDKTEALLGREMIVGYTTNGNPLTKAEYNTRLQKAEDQILAGNFISQEELEERE